jgi:hypothetical protein
MNQSDHVLYAMLAILLTPDLVAAHHLPICSKYRHRRGSEPDFQMRLEIPRDRGAAGDLTDVGHVLPEMHRLLMKPHVVVRGDFGRQFLGGQLVAALVRMHDGMTLGV